MPSAQQKKQGKAEVKPEVKPEFKPEMSGLKRIPKVDDDSKNGLSHLGEAQDSKSTFSSLKASAYNMGQVIMNTARGCFDLWMFWCVALPLYVVIALISTGEVTWETAMSQVPKTMTPQYVRSQVHDTILPCLMEKYVAVKQKMQCYYTQAKTKLPKERQEQVNSVQQRLMAKYADLKLRAQGYCTSVKMMPEQLRSQAEKIQPCLIEKYEFAKQQTQACCMQAKMKLPENRQEQVNNLQQRVMKTYANLEQQAQGHYTRVKMMPEQLTSQVKKI